MADKEQFNHTEHEKNGDNRNASDNNYISRQHKSRLFSYIFGREETKYRTLSLYNTLNGTNYTNPDDITLTTIEDVIYMGMKNDLSYIVSDRASLYSTLNINEHQATYNPNIPIREFMYAARLYDKYLKMNRKNPYSSSIIPLPIPKLVTFYNGKANTADETILRLSDAFKEEIRQNLVSRRSNADIMDEGALEKEVSDILARSAPDIEVSVRMININYGHSEGILSSCGPLNEYAWLIDRIRKNVWNGMELEQAVDSSLQDMPDQFELKEQLMAHKAEVIGMWINEYNEEETMQMFKEEGRQEGENLLATLMNKLLSLGKNEDALRVTTDTQLRESLYLQYGLKKSL